MTLSIRPGTRYACFGDGLCCTDVHVIGPLSREDARLVREVSPKAVVRHPALGILAVAPRDSGCSFLKDGACGLHASRGALAKPNACRRFPFDLVRTPTGMRVTTEHRCPCRTMGTRPLVTEEVAAEALKTRGGALRASFTVETVRLGDTEVPFGDYERREAAFLVKLAKQGPEACLPVPFPSLVEATWTDVAHHLRSHIDGSHGGDALAMAGDAILALTSGHRAPLRKRPWEPAFARALARDKQGGDGESILRDFVADVVWGLSWVSLVSWEVRLAHLATQVAVLRWIAARMVELGVREDQATAEAVMVVELMGHTSIVEAAMRQTSSPCQ